MSLREEDEQKNTCPSRGLGIAAAAIGVGVGAALYYFFSKRPENPSSGGSTSQNWNCESPSMLFGLPEEQNNSDTSYITISVNTTSDTSMYEDDTDNDTSKDTETESERSNMSISDDQDTDSDISISNNNLTSSNSHYSDINEFETSFNYETGSDMSEWDITSSLAAPYFEPPSTNFLNSFISNVISPIQARRENEMNLRRSQAFRERSWTLEECSICFDAILHSQEVMSLPCTHHFHQACILPWLQEKQTCPNCRKPID